jgi:transposase
MEPSVSSVRLDHLGMPAVMADEIGFVGTIDRMMGTDPRATLSCGQAILAMCLNALGFSSNPLYLSPEFFKRRDLKFLLGVSVTQPNLELKPDHLNEHKLGRVLDAIADFGPEKLFLGISVTAFRRMNVHVPQAHLDTSTHSFFGQYEDEHGNPNPGFFTPTDPEDDPTEVLITQGYSKDFRIHCKQIVQELDVSADGNVPLLFQAHSGNASDVVIMQERMNSLKRCLVAADAVDLMPEVLVADCKMYSRQGFETADREMTTWITRVPDTISEVEDVINQALRARGHWHKSDRDPNISFQEFIVEKFDIEQRFLVVRTKGSKGRIAKSMPRKISKDKEAIEKNIRPLRKMSFACLPDLKAAVLKACEGTAFHRLEDFKYTESEGRRGRGRPRKDAPVDGIVRELRLGDVRLQIDEQAVRQCELKSACFVIATNALSAEPNADKDAWQKVRSSEEVIGAYLKDQQGVERSFRFLKDPQYFADAFFLKSPRRVVALLMVMACALLLHSLLQRKIRLKLAELGATIPDQKNKPTSRPTIRWVNQRFEGVDVIKIVMQESVRFVYQAVDDFVNLVLRVLGPPYVERYTPVYLS